jgi:hypothetical protein
MKISDKTVFVCSFGIFQIFVAENILWMDNQNTKIDFNSSLRHKLQANDFLSPLSDRSEMRASQKCCFGWESNPSTFLLELCVLPMRHSTSNQ